MKRTLAACLLAGLSSSACAPDAGGVAAGERPIIGGTASPSPDDDAVALLVSYPADRSVMLTCTADLIAPQALVTSAHCIDAPNHPGYLYGVYFGNDASPYPTLAQLEPHLAPVTAVHPHPGYNPSPPFDADLGVVELASPAPAGIAPLPINRQPVGPALISTPARIVGFGQTMYGTFNVTRHQADTVVADIDPGDTIRVGDSTHRSCIGDSGGPALIDDGMGEVLYAIDSYTDVSGCTQPAHYTRVDLYLAFLDPYLGTAAPDAGLPTDAAGESPDAAGQADAMIASDNGDDGGCGCRAARRGGAGAAPLVPGLVFAAGAAAGMAVSRRRRCRRAPGGRGRDRSA